VACSYVGRRNGTLTIGKTPRTPLNKALPPTSSNKFCSFCPVYVYKNAVDGHQCGPNGQIGPRMAIRFSSNSHLNFRCESLGVARLDRQPTEDNRRRDSFLSVTVDGRTVRWGGKRLLHDGNRFPAGQRPRCYPCVELLSGWRRGLPRQGRPGRVNRGVLPPAAKRLDELDGGDERRQHRLAIAAYIEVLTPHNWLGGSPRGPTQDFIVTCRFSSRGT
jgi:hypothetical protein